MGIDVLLIPLLVTGDALAFCFQAPGNHSITRVYHRH